MLGKSSAIGGRGHGMMNMLPPIANATKYKKPVRYYLLS
jgi:hypothetical protein